MGEVEQQPRPADEVGRVGNVLGRLDVDLGLGRLGPGFVLAKPLLQLADAGDVLVELVAVVRVPRSDRSVLAWSRTSSRMLRPSARRRTWAWTSSARRRGTAWRTPSTARWPPGPVPRSGSRTGPPFARQGQAGESRLAADVLGRELIERDRVPKPGPARSRRAGQEAGRGLVGEPRAHPRVRQAGDDREVVAEVLEDFQVRREFVVLAGLLREEVRRVQPQRRADADHAPPLGCSLSGTGRRESVEPGQGQRHAGGLRNCLR